MADIEMPQLGETVTEGTITKWFKQVGDQVAEDEALFEVSTDKVDSEVPSPVGGYLTEILVDEGDTVDVGTMLAVVSDSPPADGGGDAEAPAERARGRGSAERRGGARADGGARGRSRAEPGRGAGGREPSPRPRRPAGRGRARAAEPEPEKPAAAEAPEPQPKERRHRAAGG